jgi:polyisoprenoid-binding protein YceI
MKKLSLLLIATAFVTLTAFVQADNKLISTASHISFYSHTDAEDITADNYKATSTLDKTTGDVVYSVPMQSFEFKKALMQKHFNSEKFLNTKAFPKSKFKGAITNISAVNFTKDGQYPVTVKGDLTIKDVTKPVTEQGTITITNGKVHVDCKMSIVLADYNISLTDGKPSTNVAKTVDITINSDY